MGFNGLIKFSKKSFGWFTKFSAFILAFLISTSIFTACEDCNAPVLLGKISGYINLLNEAEPHPDDHSGIKVYLEDTPYFTYSDQEGRFTLGNVPAGIYNIVYERDGYGHTKQMGFQFTGGGEAFLHPRYLVQLPTYEVVSISIKDTIFPGSNYYLNIEGTLNKAQNVNGQIVVFFDKKSSVSSEPSDYRHAMQFYIYSGSLNFSYQFNMSNLDDDFVEGEKVYVAAYSSNFTSYFDPSVNKIVFPNVGNNRVTASFIMK